MSLFDGIRAHFSTQMPACMIQCLIMSTYVEFAWVHVSVIACVHSWIVACENTGSHSI